MGTLKQRMQSMKMPHTYVILTGILLLVVALTYLIPAGEYARVLDPVSGVDVDAPAGVLTVAVCIQVDGEDLPPTVIEACQLV